MLLTFLSLLVIGLINFLLWSLWCRHSDTLVAADSPDWVRRPNFFVFLLVALIVLFAYRSLERRK